MDPDNNDVKEIPRVIPIICEECKINIVCSCKNESYTKLKYRSCALRDEYPISQLTIESKLIHLCSDSCSDKFNESDESMYGFLRNIDKNQRS